MRTVGLGCMRLSTDPDRDDARGIAVIHAALDAGIRFFDTADAYCRDESDRGHNERLIAAALATWAGDRAAVRIGTKGGLTRPNGRWQPDGRARHLRDACQRSLEAFRAERLDLYQLHAVDPRTPLATSVRALDQLKRDGLVAAIGLCNVTVGQLEEARRITEIASVQVELSVWHDEHILSGIVDYCLANHLRLYAHRPLGGRSRLRKTATNPTLAAIAARHAATPFEIALAWLMAISDLVVPTPGATRVDTVTSIARAARVVLTDADRQELARTLPAPIARRRSTFAAVSARPATRDGDVVIVMGMPGAGKSTAAMRMVEQGYARLNRDLTGGTLRGLLPAIDRAVDAGATRIVLDNTYATRRSRADVIRTAAAHGLPVRCLWLSTSLEDAQTNAAWRIVSRYGRLPDGAELARLRKTDAAAFLPGAQFTYRRELEPPDMSEGFSRVDVEPFVRIWDPRFANAAVIVSCDDVEDLARRAEPLRRYRNAGYRLLGISWQPGIGERRRSRGEVVEDFSGQCDRLGLDIDIEFCPHVAGPPRCWCRKPLPGLGVLLISRYLLDPARCLYIGEGPHDAGFARRLGFTLVP